MHTHKSTAAFITAAALLLVLPITAQEGVAVSLRNGTSTPPACRETGRNVFLNRLSNVLSICVDGTFTGLTVGGITQAAADLRYLKIAADNGPLTGQLALASTGLSFPGATSGTTSLVATAIAGTTTLTLPAATDTLVGKATTDTLTNKSISLATNTLTATSAQLVTAISDETGSGLAVFGTSPALTTPTINTSFAFVGTGSHTFDASISAGAVDLYRTGGSVGMRFYNSRTDASNYARSFLAWSSQHFQIGTSSAGTGVLGDLQLVPGGATVALNLAASSGNVSLPIFAVTAGTMTGTYESVVSAATTCRSWTNAQVVALGATTAGDIAWGTLPAKYIVRNAYIVITGAAAGPATVTVSLGRTSASYIDYIVASDAKAAANTVYGDASAERGTNLTGYDLPSYTATTLINAHFVSTGANLSTVTASTGTICITLDKLP